MYGQSNITYVKLTINKKRGLGQEINKTDEAKLIQTAQVTVPHSLFVNCLSTVLRPTKEEQDKEGNRKHTQQQKPPRTEQIIPEEENQRNIHKGDISCQTLTTTNRG